MGSGSTVERERASLPNGRQWDNFAVLSGFCRAFSAILPPNPAAFLGGSSGEGYNPAPVLRLHVCQKRVVSILLCGAHRARRPGWDLPLRDRRPQGWRRSLARYTLRSSKRRQAVLGDRPRRAAAERTGMYLQRVPQGQVPPGPAPITHIHQGRRDGQPCLQPTTPMSVPFRD